MMMGNRRIIPATSVEEDNNQECRLCLVKIKAKSPVYSLFRPWSSPWDGMEANIVDDLNILTNIGVTEADFLSEVICGTCNAKLMRACQFVKSIHHYDAILKKRLERISSNAWPKPIQLDTNIYRTDGMDLGIKKEILTDDEYDAGDINTVEVEPEVITRQSYSQYQLHTGGKSQDKSADSSAQDYMDEEYLDMVKEEPCGGDSGLPPDCLLCSKTFKCVSGLKAHVIAQHSYKSVKRRAKNAVPSPAKKPRSENVCQICRRAFATPTDLMVHATCHDKAACYVCARMFKDFDELAKHRARCRPADAAPKTLQDVKRQTSADPKPASETPILTCPSCPEQFTDAYYMKIHTEIHHAVSSNEVSDLNSNGTLNSESGITSSKDTKNSESLESIFGIAIKHTSAKDTESNDTQDSVLPHETSEDTNGTNKDSESIESILGVSTPENGNDSVDTNENLKYANNDSERVNVVTEDADASVADDNTEAKESVRDNNTGEEEANGISEANDVVTGYLDESVVSEVNNVVTGDVKEGVEDNEPRDGVMNTTADENISVEENTTTNVIDIAKDTQQNNETVVDTQINETVDDTQENNETVGQIEGANTTEKIITRTEEPNKTEAESLECILGIEVKSGEIDPEQNQTASVSNIEQDKDNAESGDAMATSENIRIESVTNDTKILESIFGMELNRAKADVPSIVNSN